MNPEVQKIWQFVHNNHNVLKYLFMYDFNTQDMNEYMLTSKYYSNMSEYEINTVKNSEWLYRSILTHAILIGVEEDCSVNAINDTGEIGVFCDDFFTIPYEFLRLELRYSEKSTQNYLKSNPEFQKALLVYEFWAKENNIKLDKYNIYHNANGELFKEYFEW